MYELIEKYKRISFIGMCKNAGKTTAMNSFIDKCFKKGLKLGITSIGRDGEDKDVIYDIAKPKIYVEKGTIVATAYDCIEKSSIGTKILENTNISTAMGDIIIFEALNSDYIEIAGPPYKSAIKDVSDKMEFYGVDIIFIDGALGRKGSADKYVSDAAILSTGIAYSTDINKIVSDTIFAKNMLSLDSVDFEIETNSSVSIVNNDKSINELSLKTSLNSANEVIKYLDKDSRYLVLQGAFAEDLAEQLVINRKKLNNLTVVVENGTKVFITKKQYENMLKANIGLKAVDSINVLAVTINPTSPKGEVVDKDLMLKRFNEKLDCPVINVKKV